MFSSACQPLLLTPGHSIVAAALLWAGFFPVFSDWAGTHALDAVVHVRNIGLAALHQKIALLHVPAQHFDVPRARIHSLTVSALTVLSISDFIICLCLAIDR